MMRKHFLNAIFLVVTITSCNSPPSDKSPQIPSDTPTQNQIQFSTPSKEFTLNNLLVTEIQQSFENLGATGTICPSETPRPTLPPYAHPKTGYYYYTYDYILSIYEPGSSEPVFSVNQFEFFPQQPTISPYTVLVWKYLDYPEWSPDGRYLAYLGMINNLYSDLYVFDTETRTNRRLTDGWNHAVSLSWSPNSDWIIFEDVTSSPNASEDFTAAWAARPDGSEVRWLFDPDAIVYIPYWIDDHRFYAYEEVMSGDTVLRLVDLQKEETIIIFDFSDRGGIYFFRAFDPDTGALAFITFGDYFEENGVYLVTPWTPTPRLIVRHDEYDYKTDRVLWDEENGVFSTPAPCKDDPALFTVFTPLGEISCGDYSP